MQSLKISSQLLYVVEALADLQRRYSLFLQPDAQGKSLSFDKDSMIYLTLK